MKDLFVPYELAVKLRDKGFNVACLATIDQTDFIHIKGTKYPVRGAMCYMEYPAPLWQQVIDWLREEKKIIILIEHNCTNYQFCLSENYDVHLANDRQYDFDEYDWTRGFGNYYSALQSGIEKALEII